MTPVILDLIPARIYRKDSHGRFTYGNRACLQDLGLDKLEDLIGKTDFDFFESGFAQKLRMLEVGLLASGSPIYEQIDEELWLDGRVTWTQTSRILESDESGTPRGIMGVSLDITRRSLELQRYQRAVEGHRDGVWQYDAREQDLWLSPQCRDILQLDDASHLPIREWLSLVHLDDRDEILHLFATISPDNPCGEVDCRIRRRDSTYVPVRIRSTTIFDSTTGLPYLHSGSISDRSEFEEQEANFRSILDLVPSFIYVKDRHFRFEFVNRAFADGFGKSVQQILGMTDEDLISDSKKVAWFRRDDMMVLQSKRPVTVLEESFDHRSLGRRILSTIKVARPGQSSEAAPTGVVGLATDITELVEMRRHLEALIENIPDGVFFKNCHGQFTRVNSAMARILGSASEQQCIGKTDADFFPPNASIQSLTEEQQLLATGIPIFADVRPTISNTTGAKQWRRVSKIPVRDPNGIIVGLVGITHDLTAERQVQDMLRRQSQLLETVIDTIPLQVSLQDLDGKYLLCNRNFANYLGLERPAEVIGHTDHSLIRDPDAVARLERLFTNAARGVPVIEYDYTERDQFMNARRFTVSLYPVVEKDTEPARTLAVLTIREPHSVEAPASMKRQQARLLSHLELLEWIRREEDALRRSYILLLGLTHSDSLGFNRALMFRHRPAAPLRLTFVLGIGQLSECDSNEFYYTFRNLEVTPLQQCLDDFDHNNGSPDEALNGSLRDRRITIDPKGRLGSVLRRAEQLNTVIIETGATVEQFGELWLLLQELDSREALVAIMPIDESETLIVACDNIRSQAPIGMSEDGQPVFASMTEAFIKNSRVAIAAAKRQADERKRSSKEEAWRQMAHDISHRMDNILPFTMNTIRRLISHSAPHRSEHDLLEIEKDIESASELMREFKRYAAPIEIAIRMRTWITVDDFVDRIRQYIDKTIVLQATVSPEVAELWLQVDVERLKQDCFAQLAQNAIRHSGSDNLECTLNASSVSPSERFKLGMRHSATWIQILFTDNGRGIPHDCKDKIFEPLYSTAADGTGLGLAIVKRVVEAHGSQIDEIGEAGFGASFRVMIPAWNKPEVSDH